MEKILTTENLEKFYEKYKDGFDIADLNLDNANFFKKLTVRTYAKENPLTRTQGPTVSIGFDQNKDNEELILIFTFYNLKSETGAKGPRGYRGLAIGWGDPTEGILSYSDGNLYINTVNTDTTLSDKEWVI